MRALLPALLILLLAAPASAQAPSADAQIAGAVSPAPPDRQAGAHVYGYDAEGRWVTLREGTNDLICLADDPSDDRFHAACYHRSLEPFMARGRELRDEGKSRDERMQIREEEIEAGLLPMPRHPATLYSFSGPIDVFDPATGVVEGASRLNVVYLAYATPETTGLPTSAPRGQPWLMDAGKPWAHIMLIEPQ